MADRLVKGAHVLVPGELTTREYDRTIKVPAGKGKTIVHTIPQLVVELRADTIRIVDRSGATCEQSDAAEPAIGEVADVQGRKRLVSFLTQHGT